jgi:transcriptional accessory protein Tex/SPT6
MDIDGTIARYQDNGIVVDLGGDLEGFVPQSQLPLPDGKSAESVTKEGQGVALKVLEVDPIHHRIILSAIEFYAPPPEEEKPAEAPQAEAAESPEAVEAPQADAAESPEPVEAAEPAEAPEAEASGERAEAASEAEEPEATQPGA